MVRAKRGPLYCQSASRTAVHAQHSPHKHASLMTYIGEVGRTDVFSGWHEVAGGLQVRQVA